MVLQKNYFDNALSIEDMEQRLKHSLTGAIAFFFEGSCIETQPPLPPGAGK